MGVRDLRLLRSIALASVFLLCAPALAQASPAEWNQLGSGEYVYGYSTKMFACWSLGDASRVPELQTLQNGAWVTASAGQILPATASLSSQCSNPSYPTPVGYVWQVMVPPPAQRVLNRPYSVTYRQSLPDKTLSFTTNETQLVSVPHSIKKRVAYKVRVWKHGRRVTITKYKYVRTTWTTEEYRTVAKQTYTTLPGIVSDPAAVGVWASIAEERAYAASIAIQIGCAFGVIGC